jgi:hypothetical protein
MEASKSGIDLSSSALAVLVAFAGDTEDQSCAFFKIKGKKLLVAATSKRFAIELEGAADDTAEQGEWPVHKRFLSELSDVTVDGSAKVPAITARLLLERTGVSRADLIIKETGARHGGHETAVVRPENRQLTFKQIHDTIDVDFANAGGSWFPIEKKAHRALGAVYAAAAKNTPVSIMSGLDESSPIGFQAQGDGFMMRGILIPPAVQGPGKAMVDGDEDEDDEEEDERQPKLPGVDGDDDDAVISDEQAAALKAEAQGGKAPEKKARKTQKRKKAGS